MSQTIGLDFSSNSYIEAQWYMFSLIFLLGAGYTLRNKGHVRVDIIYSRVSRRAQTWTNIFDTVTFLMPATLLILWASLPYTGASSQILEMLPDPSGLPRYLIKSVIPPHGYFADRPGPQ